jgi:hypothetical protein
LFDDTKSILQSDKLKLNDKLTLPKTWRNTLVYGWKDASAGTKFE